PAAQEPAYQAFQRVRGRDPADLRCALTPRLKDPRPEVRAAAVRALLFADRDGASAPDVAGRLQDESADVRRWAAYFFTRRPTEQAGLVAPGLVKCLEDPDPRVRADAALALGQGDPQAALPALERLVKTETDKQVREVAGEVLQALREADDPD